MLVGLWNQILDSLVRYGYEPARAIAWSMIPLVTGWLVFGVAYQAGHMVPNSFVSTRKEWIACKDISSLSPQLGLKTFVSELFRRENSVDKCLHYRPPYTPGVDAAPAAGLVDYPQFNPFWYTLDTFLPIVSLHQEEHWTPGPKSSIARHYLTVHILLGWLMVTLGLSGMLGLIQRRATSALR